MKEFMKKIISDKKRCVIACTVTVLVLVLTVTGIVTVSLKNNRKRNKDNKNNIVAETVNVKPVQETTAEETTEEQTEEQKRYLKELLEDYPLKMDAIVVITDGETLISSNEKQYKTIKEDEGWYRREGAYKQYDLYVFFPKEGVFRERNNSILGCLAVYGVLCLFLVFMRFHKRRRKGRENCRLMS